MFIVQGSTVGEQIRHIDRILKRLSQHTFKTIIGVVPPIPLSGYATLAEIDKVCFAFMVPSDGVIREVLVSFDDPKVKAASINVCAISGGRKLNHEIPLKQGLNKLNIKEDMKAGDRVVCSLLSAEPVKAEAGKEVTGVCDLWVSFLFDVDQKVMSVHKFIRESLLEGGGGDAS